MPNLLEQIQGLTSNAGVAGDLAAQAGSLGDIVSLVQSFSEAPPGDFAGALAGLGNVALPNVSLGGALSEGFGGVLPALTGELGGLIEPVLGAAARLGSTGGLDFSATLEPILRAVADLRTLLDSDWSCGLLSAFGGAASPSGGEPPAEEPEAPAPTPPAAATSVLTADQVARASAVLEALPADMTVPSLLTWLHERLGAERPHEMRLRALPLIDELRDPLDTLVRWQGQTGAELANELGHTLALIASVIERNGSGLISAALPAATVAALPLAALGVAAAALATALGELEEAVAANDLPAVATRLSVAQEAALDVEAANALFDARATAIDGLIGSLRALPSELEMGVCRLLVLVEPRSTFGAVTSALGAELPVATDAVFAPVHDALDTLQEFLENLLGLLDLSLVTEPLEQVLNGTADAVEELAQRLTELTVSARAVFENAEASLSALDAGAAIEQGRAALEDAVSQVQGTLAQLFGPATAALGSALGAAETALDAFDPEALAAPIAEVIAGIAGLFEGEEVQQILAQLERLKELAGQLEALRFTPVADVVIGGIGEVRSALDGIDETNLPDPMPELIREAMSILPTSLVPLTDPLLSGLDTLIEEGPVPLLEALRDLPKPIVDELQRFSPRALLEEPLGKPFEAIRQALDEFEPTHWLDVAEQELGRVRERVGAALDVGAVLEPLVRAHGALLEELGRFRPGAVLDPIAERIEEGMQAVRDALPTGEIVAGLDQVLGRARTLQRTLEHVVQLGAAWHQKFVALGDVRVELEAWLDEILGKLPSDAGTSLAAPLGALSGAVAGLHASALGSAYDAAVAGLAAGLSAVGPTALTELVQARSRLTPSLLGALDDSPAKTALASWLASFDPASPGFSRGLRQATRLRDARAAADATLAELWVHWDARHLRPDGALATLVPVAPTSANLAGFLRDAIERQLGSVVRVVFAALKGATALLGRFVDTLGGLVSGVSQKLDQVLAVPEALAELAARLDSLSERLLGFDLHVFTREVDELYSALLDHLRALDPRALGQALREGLDALLGTLSLDGVLTPALRAELATTYATLKRKLDAIDPELLVIRPLEEVYASSVLPAVEALDLSDSIQIIIDRLNGLPEELRAELGRVDTEYQAMLAAAPGGSGGALGA
jgi:hypothetical protein